MYKNPRVPPGFLQSWPSSKRVFMARFPYQNSTILLVFKIRHSFLKFVIRLSRLTFVFFFRLNIFILFFKFDVQFIQLNIRFSTLTFVLFHWAFVFQLWRSFYSIQHFFIRHLYFKFDIWVINSSNRFSTLTFVLQVQHSLFVQLKILNVDKTASKWLKNKRCSE